MPTTLLIFLITLVQLEIGLRVTGRAPRLPANYIHYSSTPDLPWLGKPRSSGKWEGPEFNFKYAHNSLGFRDREHAAAKAPGSLRLVFLGDSYTYGIGAEAAETFPAVVESRLADRHAEVINLAIPGYYPELEALAFKYYGAPTKPDVVLVAVSSGDVVDTFWGRAAIVSDSMLVTRRAERLGATGRWMYVHSHLFRAVYKVTDYFAWAGTINRADVPDRAEVFRAGGKYEADWRRLESDLDDIAARAKTIGARVGLIYLPTLEDLVARPRDHYALDRYARWARHEGAFIVDTLTPLVGAGAPGKLYFPQDGHPTPAGYRLIGSTVANALRLQ